MSMQRESVPIQERRAWYNALGRRVARGGLKAGLLEKYQASSGSSRWEMVKAFMCDEDMCPRCTYFISLMCVFSFSHCLHARRG